MREILIRIHPDVFSRCPRLSRIFLVDRREEYRLDEVVRWTPTELPLLKELVLNGTPAISFHPDILHSTTNLRDLDLGMFTSGADVTFIPPAEELDCADDDNIDDNNKNNDSLSTYGSVPRKQPTWTWDWYLPNLLSLKLNAEFGYRFKFRMLAGTPNLTLERQHVVGDIDNSSSPIELEENDDKFLKDFEYVHVPALKNFTLTGPWSLDRRVLEVLFGKVAPGVQDLIMSSEGHNELPKLIYLTLNGEFAYRFQFRILAGTPNLQEYIHLPHVEDISFSVHGSSFATVTVTARRLVDHHYGYSELFYKTTLNIKELKMVANQGYSFKDWTASTRNLIRLKTAYTSLATITSFSGGEGKPMEGLIAEAWLEVVPEFPEHDRRYVLVDQPVNRRKECLEAIIRTLACFHGMGSVATMLRVNKYVCSITLPVLYGLGPISVLNKYYLKDSLGFKRRQKLIATLLLGVPKIRITELLRVTFLQDSIDDQDHSPAPYAPYHSFATAISLSNCNDAFDGDLRQIDEFRDDYFSQDDGSPPSQRLLDFVKDHRLLRRDLTWALCSDVERLRFLEIPVSDIDRYLPLIDQLKALTKVRFELNRWLFPTNVDLDELTPEQRTILSHQRDERKQHLDQMVLFVQGHRRHHGSVLQAATCSGEYPLLAEKCPDEYAEQLTHLLPPLPDPRALDIHNWGHFATKVKETNLLAVKSIMPPQGQPGALSLPQLLKKSPFLHRCRSLESIQLKSFTDDVFQWAVDERRQHDADIAAGRTPQRPLVPLQNATVNNERPTDGRLINDIGYSFGETLKTLHFYSYATFDNQESVVLGECSVGGSPSWSLCWHAPQLTNLLIRTDHNFLRIHPSLLAQCPQLKDINLVDRRHEYSASDITRWEPAELGQLETLTLQGSPALSFNLETLNTARKLKTISLRTSAHYVLPVAELDEPENDSVGLPPSAAATAPSPIPPWRPIWTWDWDLPRLTRLTLKGDMAYRFQFKMLQGTPSLVQLNVDIRSTTGIHKRTLGVKEFLQKTQEIETMGGAQDDDDNNSNNNDGSNDNILGMQSKYIQLPALRTLTLRGTWVLDTEVLESLCRMVPGVTNMSLQGCGGFSLVDWVGTTSRLLMSISQAKASIPVAAELASKAGLVEMELHGEDQEYVLYQLGQPPVGRTAEDKLNYYFYPYIKRFPLQLFGQS
ncbi:hypothetical protein KI688_010422 [Linnemannia hyalina]|uniref:Uncharacterized protein n=1 Tax=Linnemannia hyalina TaxID=64524 RepID=A0A9P8BUM2_9FUNG|nr:hypothetical protein KI688_010422 [Linnemannia hyalina]